MKILDCTLRDGGYYTNWDFDDATLGPYLKAMDSLPVDVVEVGYRSNPSAGYLGQFGYSPVSSLKVIKASCSKKIAIMLNEKSVRTGDLETLLMPISGIVDIVRLAVDPSNFDRALDLSRAIRKMGFIVSFNMMYMSTWKSIEGIYAKIANLEGAADVFCMVDSFGGITPEEVKDTVSGIREVSSITLGFHGHDNLELGLINTLTAMKLGVEYVDATILGMGRGAGNLKLELLLSYLNRRDGVDVDFNVLSDAIVAFEPLRDKYRWETSLPYMISGANDIPQKEVMSWVSNRLYSFNSIVRALDNRRNHRKDNARFPILPQKKKYASAVIIGGGMNAATHSKAITSFLSRHPDYAVIFATARHAAPYLGIANDHYYCITGNEGKRLMDTVGEDARKGVCVLPPYPREMGTDVPECVRESSFELKEVGFIDAYADSVTAIALELASEISSGDVFLVGYDGYPGKVLSEKERTLTEENMKIFNAFCKSTGRGLKSLTPSIYSNLIPMSVYQYL